MERQYKHRILGILVIIGLVVISLPLFQDGKELSTQISAVKTPPFPDQPLQFEAAISDAAQQPPRPETAPVTPQATNDNESAKPAEGIISAVHPSVVTAQPTENVPVKTASFIEEPKKTIHTIKFAQKAANPDKGLLKLNSATWVLQIGSYKNKTNALRVVNQLRANGYRAFLQQITTALGNHTRVFVGPEAKRTTARALADRLHSEMHIQAIVVSYKPLAV